MKKEYFSTWLLFFVGLGELWYYQLSDAFGNPYSIFSAFCSAFFSLILQGGSSAVPLRQAEASRRALQISWLVVCLKL